MSPQLPSKEPKITTDPVRGGKEPLRTSFFVWQRLWRRHPPDWPLLIICLITALIMALPIVYVAWRSLFAGADRWMNLLDSRIPGLLWNTLSLTIGVTALAVIIGTVLAWLVHRTDLPGTLWWRWLLALPLVIPPYVGAMTYIIVFGPRGWVRTQWQGLDWLTQRVGDYPLNIYSFWGVLFVLTMFTYPYVFLIVGASLQKLNRNYEDIARSQGMGIYEVFRNVTFPMLRPAIGAGGILVGLYVLSDFGAIAILRFNTFTSAIYYQMSSNYDNVAASVLSVVLIALTLLFLSAESLTRSRRKFYQTSNSYVPPDRIELGRWRPLALIIVMAVFTISVLLPILVLMYWSNIGIAQGALNTRFWVYAWNSIQVSGLAAIFAMIMAMPLVYLKSRHPSIASSFIDKLAYAGYALPGVIVALGIVFFFNQYVPVLYNSFILIALAMIIRFLPQALQSGSASLSLISPRIDEAARSLGYPPWKVVLRVIVPLMTPGILAGGALVFVSSIKELPATLLLRPPGFDTLSVRVWVEASESIYHMAAPAALVIILISIIPLRWLLRKY